jgi:ribonuclease VapC
MALSSPQPLHHRIPGDEGRVAQLDEDLAARAVDAWRRFGKGRHPAQPNFGDCCTHALPERPGHPILCVSEDSTRTGLRVRRPPG